MSIQQSEDVPMEGSEGHLLEGPQNTNPSGPGPRVLIDHERLTIRPHPDGKARPPLDWAGEKESEIAGKEKKARRKEKKKQKLAEGEPKQTGHKPEKAKTETKATMEAQAPKKVAKSPAGPAPTSAKSGGHKRKIDAEEEAAAKKRMASQQPPSKGSANVGLAPPIKRKDMSKEQRSAMNKAKRDAQKIKKKSAKAAGKQPAQKAEAEGEEDGEQEKSKALSKSFPLGDFVRMVD